jgi:L-cysteine/cystine lyase
VSDGNYLEVIDGPAAGETVSLKSEVVLGRVTEAIAGFTADDELSRRHARVAIAEDGHVIIEDLGSLNGTYLNGIKVQRAMLTPNDIVRVGRSTLRLRHGDSDETLDTTSETPPQPQIRDAVGLLRRQFPIMERLVHLNTASRGPAPAVAVEAAVRAIAEESTSAHDADCESRTGLRRRLASLVGGRPDEISLNRGGTDGVNTVLWGMNLRRHDEIVASEEETHGVLAAIDRVGRRFGIDVRLAPILDVANAAGPRTRLVVCSHVGRLSGAAADMTALAATGAVVLVEGSHALGSVIADVGYINCDYYCGDTRAWLCGPPGVGMLWARSSRQAALTPPWPGDASLSIRRPDGECVFHKDARRYDIGAAAPGTDAWLDESLTMLESAGWTWIADVATSNADRLAAALVDAGLEVVARGNSAIVSWRTDDVKADVERLTSAGIRVDGMPEVGLLRASVGAWTTEEELDRLVQLAMASR